jgi:hypothetical protein
MLAGRVAKRKHQCNSINSIAGALMQQIEDRDIPRLPDSPLPLRTSTSATVRIKPQRGLFELRLCELWAYRELLYFFVWRDVKVRYKQTVIGIAWVVLQPLMTVGRFHCFLRPPRQAPIRWLSPIPFSISPR